MKILRDVMMVAVSMTFLCWALIVLEPQNALKPAHAQPTLLGPNTWAYTAVTAAQQLVPPNPSRHALQICNAGGTNILWIAPQGNTLNTLAPVVPAANGAGSVGVPVTPAGGAPSCFSPPVNAPSIGQGWNGFSATTPVTVYEWP